MGLRGAQRSPRLSSRDRMQRLHLRFRLLSHEPQIVLSLQIDPDLRLSAEHPASLTAISGVIGARPLTIAETCLRVTPSASATFVTVTPSGTTGEHLQDWRRGRVPYLERVIHCNLARKANVGGPSPSAPTDPNLKAAAPARRHSASLRDIIANISDGVTRDGMTNRAGGRYSWRRRYPREAPAMSRFRGCLMVLAAALWGAGAAVSVAEPRAGSPADGTLTAIVGATVVHPELEGAAASSSDSTRIIAGKRIKAVGPATTTKVPRGARGIDGHGKWVMPGLVDSHVHLFQSVNAYTPADAADFGAWRPYAAEVQRNQARLPQTFRVWLASGVTSVADVGGPFWNFQVRDDARNNAAAPRAAVTGPLISMVEDPKLDLGDPPIVRINSGEEARQLVARELEHKPDYIKVWF